MSKSTIKVNGEDRRLDGEHTIETFLASLGLDPRLVAIEHNGSLVRRPRFSETPLGDGDRLEIVRFVQGG